MGWMERIRAQERAAVSLVELMLVVALMMIVVVAFGNQLTGAYRFTEVARDESAAIDDLQVAVQFLEREVRSAECIKYADPGSGTGHKVELETHHAQQNGRYMSRYEIDATTGQLTRTADGVTSVLVDGIDAAANTFSYAGPVDGQRRWGRLDIDLKIQGWRDHGTRRVETTLTARNAEQTCI